MSGAEMERREGAELLRHARIVLDRVQDAEMQARVAIEAATDAWRNAGTAVVEAGLVVAWLEQRMSGPSLSDGTPTVPCADVGPPREVGDRA